MPYYPPPSAGGGSPFVHKFLSSDDIKALHSSKFGLVTGVAGKLYLPTACAVQYHHVTTPYTIAAGNLVVLLGEEGDGPFAMFGMSTDTLTSSDSNGIVDMPSYVDMLSGGGIASNFVVGKGLSLWIDNANPTVGDGTMDVWLYYTPIDINV